MGEHFGVPQGSMGDAAECFECEEDWPCPDAIALGVDPENPPDVRLPTDADMATSSNSRQGDEG